MGNAMISMADYQKWRRDTFLHLASLSGENTHLLFDVSVAGECVICKNGEPIYRGFDVEQAIEVYNSLV